MDLNSNTYSANGKLLLTAEYAVLFGALALALPARKGQRLTVLPGYSDGLLHWNSRELGNTWFQATLALPGFEVIKSSDEGLASRLSELLRTVRRLSPAFLSTTDGSRVNTDLDFPRNWGLGTSSTLIYLVSRWAGVDPYLLLQATFGGSGYDIACADRARPIFFHRSAEEVSVEETSFRLPFLQNIYLGFSGLKKDSGQDVRKVLQQGPFPEKLLERISEISQLIQQSKDIQEFTLLMKEHEELLSSQLGLAPVAHSFPGFPGLVKSLGAWGGDFHLFTWEGEHEELRLWLGKRGTGPVFCLDELLYID
ncbi:MAG: GHMP kinase [Bacteroidales bacterium]|nr:GHMP kinase [Bacteroidales bacterium]